MRQRRPAVPGPFYEILLGCNQRYRAFLSSLDDTARASVSWSLIPISTTWRVWAAQPSPQCALTRFHIVPVHGYPLKFSQDPSN